MSQDGHLRRLAIIADEGKGDSKVWVIISSCILTGTLTHLGNLKAVIPPQLHDNFLHERKQIARDNYRNFNWFFLQEVQIENGAGVIYKPWARLALDEIDAWGFA